MKVARAAGHKTIYPIDFPMLMSGLRYDEVEIKQKEASSASATVSRTLTEDEVRLRQRTIQENLQRLNDPAAIASGHAAYMDLLKPDPQNPALYEKADLLTNWYKRNIRMMANLRRMSQPGDRVLLVVGSGHLAILRDLAAASPDLCLADTMRYLKTGENP